MLWTLHARFDVVPAVDRPRRRRLALLMKVDTFLWEISLPNSFDLQRLPFFASLQQ